MRTPSDVNITDTKNVASSQTDFSAARMFLANIIPWPDDGQTAYGNIHTSFKDIDPATGKERVCWSGRACTSVDEAMNCVQWALKQPNTVGIYYCVSSQSRCETKTSAKGYTTRKAVRAQQFAVALKSFFIDIDFKAYDKPDDAVVALGKFVAAVGWPKPSVIVKTGGGMHVYYVLDRALAPAEWSPIAFSLAEATKQHGLKCDTQCTIDSARILRVPQTWNNKPEYGTPRPVEVVGIPEYVTYTVERIAKPLEPYKVAVTATSNLVYPVWEGLGVPVDRTQLAKVFQLKPGEQVVNELGAGIEERHAPPTDLEDVRKECKFIDEAITTGGKGYTNPLWNLTTLISTFAVGGKADAHRMGNQHPGYTPASTDEFYDRKVDERQAKNLGWPKCVTISGHGCKLCQKCPHFTEGKSPLNFGKLVEVPAAQAPIVRGPVPPAGNVAQPAPGIAQSANATPGVTPQPTTTGFGLTASITSNMSVSFTNVRHRQFLYGADLSRGEVTVSAAPGGTGKTSHAIGMCVSLVVNKALLEERIWAWKPKVLYINGEDSTEENTRRIWAFCLQHGLSQQDIQNLLLIGADDWRTKRLSFLHTQGSASVIDQTSLDFLKVLLSDARPDLLVLDPLISFCGGGNINDNAVMGQVMRALKQLASDFNCAILILHHTRKGGDLSSAEAISGASSIVNLARRAIMVMPMTSEEAPKLGVLPSEHRSYFKIVSAKSNLAPPSHTCPWYKLESVTLPNAEPPTYPSGDHVQAVVRVQLPVMNKQPDPDDLKIKRAIAGVIQRGKLIDGQYYPYSPKTTPGGNNIRPILDDAVKAAAEVTAERQWRLGDLEAVVTRAIEEMKAKGWLGEFEIKGGRFGRAKGLRVKWSHTPWYDVSPDASGGAEAPEGGPTGDAGGPESGPAPTQGE
jgi:hypothetical protein